MTKQRRVNHARTGGSPTQRPYLRHDEVVRRGQQHQIPSQTQIINQQDPPNKTVKLPGDQLGLGKKKKKKE